MSENGLHKIPVMRSALVAIQELHEPVSIMIGFTTAGAKITESVCKHCTQIADPGTYFPHPCATRRLADKGLKGESHE